MTHPLNGASRVHFIVGDPITQVKSPGGVTEAFHAMGLNAYVMPAHVTPADLSTWVAGVSLTRNLDSIIVTVPHKFAARSLCATATDRAAFVGAVNVMRRNPDGSWQGDMCDGLGFISAMRKNGGEPLGKRALLVGAGGAGSAIAHALVVNGVRQLAIHDEDGVRRKALIDRLQALGQCEVVSGTPDPTGFDLVLNATPVGMKPADPYPIEVAQLTASMFVGCVITAPAITPLIAAAREKGCSTSTGADMFAQVRDHLLAFLLEK